MKELDRLFNKNLENENSIKMPQPIFNLSKCDMTLSKLKWKNDSLISSRSLGKKNKYRLIYNIDRKSANATLEIYRKGCNVVKVFGNDFEYLKKVAQEMETWNN